MSFYGVSVNATILLRIETGKGRRKLELVTECASKKEIGKGRRNYTYHRLSFRRLIGVFRVLIGVLLIVKHDILRHLQSGALVSGATTFGNREVTTEIRMGNR
jgi:hypothetical protein